MSAARPLDSSAQDARAFSVVHFGVDVARRPRSQLRTRAAEILRDEATAIQDTAHLLNEQFDLAVCLLLALRGSLILTGMGKAGWIANKLAATFGSTGTPAHFLHPAEAVHGDLGRLHTHDVVLALSNSGQTEELTRILPALRKQTAALIAITANPHSPLGQQADVCIPIARNREACHLNLAPSSSTAAMLALGDALALVVSEQRKFTASQFAAFHPAGTLGLGLHTVDEVMRPIEQCRLASADCTLREVLVGGAKPGRRSGAVMLTGRGGELVGVYTDSDLARLLEVRGDTALDRPIAEVMCRRFTAITSGAAVGDAVELLAVRKFSELPVIDAAKCPIGMIDVTDILPLLSKHPANPSAGELPPTIRIFR